jgi:hypothetical protein
MSVFHEHTPAKEALTADFPGTVIAGLPCRERITDGFCTMAWRLRPTSDNDIRRETVQTGSAHQFDRLQRDKVDEK